LCCLHRRLLQLQRKAGRPTHNTATGAALTCCGWASTPAATLRGINVASALTVLTVICSSSEQQHPSCQQG
jgi:hypothetical protein